ncbi:DUF1553 domain-containing protein [bacterium]|nr:DUF1553 domain-containing protein [bacterium]
MIALAGLVSLWRTESCIADESLRLLPESVQLTGPRASQRLLLERQVDSRLIGQVLDGIEWSSDAPLIAKVVDGVVVPVANGSATITAKTNDGSASVNVTVEKFDVPHEWSFRNHVQAVLARQACNSGACHGALAGKGGFRLSLRGYDPAADHFSMVKDARGRRVELADPGRSLLLAKPTGALPHKGGLRFDTDSPSYQILAEWISAGAKPPADSDPVVTRIEVLPEDVRLTVGQEQQFLVLAHYSDGHTEDVTEWAKFTSTNETVAKISDDGMASVIGHGGGAVTAWFASRIVIARLTSPFPYDIPADVFTSEPRRNFIDDLVLGKLQDLHLKPSPLCTDNEFIRRAFLDTIGTLPTIEEVTAFEEDASPDKRDALIDLLLARPEFVDYWTYKWCDVLTISGNRLRPQAVEAYYKWIRNEVAENTPWDEFVRKIVTSTGSSIENGATNFFALHQDPENMAENVSQAFMGLSIACAKCHNHPLEKWTNNQYYAFANLFSRIRAKGWGGDVRSGDGVRTLYVVPAGELVQPRTGRPQPPTPLDGDPVAFDAREDRREHVAAWLTSPANPYFTRSITNRLWANFFGVGIVNEVDDLRRSNPASNEALLAAAAQHLVDADFNLKSLMRTILQSRTYQRSSVALDENREEDRYFSRYYPKRLMAEVLLDAVSQVTQVPTEFTHVAFPGGDRQETKFYPKGTRAIQLYDSAVESYFLKTFGRNDREITCECERSEEPSMVQVLHIANGDTINSKLSAKDNRLTALLASEKSDEEVVDEVFRLCLARKPTEKERNETVAVLNAIPDSDAEQKRIVLEDVFWSVMSTREFLFNH